MTRSKLFLFWNVPLNCLKRIGIVQIRSSEDKGENLKRSIDFIANAAGKGAHLVCFPEFQMAFSPASQSASQLADVAETVKGNFISALALAAKKNRIGVVATIYEKSNKLSRVFDTAVMISPAGIVSSVYRKLHLYNALGFKESAKLVPGKRITKPAKTKAGTLGLLICYDLRFPELSRILTVKGAEVLVAPSAWVAGEMKKEHWETMIKARAIENGSYVVAPDQLGNIYCGNSMVVDPFGVVLLDMNQREGVEVVDIDKSRVRQVRKSLPLLQNRRKDVYKLSF
jgi:deaminated glutathione amidase